MILPGYDAQYYFFIEQIPTPPDAPILFSSEDLMNSFNDATKRIVSFKVKEEEYAAVIIELTILDNIGFVSKVFRRGQRFTIEWGMKNTSFLSNFLNLGPQEVFGTPTRKIDGFVITSNGFFEGGKHFRTVVIRSGQLQHRAKLSGTFKGTVGDVIHEKAAQMAPNIPTVNFPQMAELITIKNPVAQMNETNHEFLIRLAAKYGCRYWLNTTVAGDVLLFFISFEMLKTMNTTEVRGILGQYQYFDYGNDKSNILESPTYDMGLGSSMGSVPRFERTPDGRVLVTFSASGTENTSRYVLDAAQVKKDLQSRSTREAAQLTQMVEAADFGDFMEDDLIKRPFNRWFTLEKFTTAPEQMGWQFDCDVVPNSIYQVGDRCWLGPTSENGQSVLPPDLKSFRKAARPEISANHSTWRLAKLEWEHTGSGVTQKVAMKR